jgi:hypothetical protein
MLIYITGVAGSGKSTLRDELTSRGYRAEDGDSGFCAWFDEHNDRVPTMPLHLRTQAWYAAHQWRLLPERVSELATRCTDSVGFLLGVAANPEDVADSFTACYYLTADADTIEQRLKTRDGESYSTRFAAFASVRAWQQSAEETWETYGYLPLDSARPSSELADELLRLHHAPADAT